MSVYDLTMIKQALDILADDLQMTVTCEGKSTTARICSGRRSVEQQMRRNSTASAHEEYDAGAAWAPGLGHLTYIVFLIL